MKVQKYSTFLTSATDGGWLSNRKMALATESVYTIIYNKPTRCNSGGIVFIKNYKYALHVSDALCVHHQEHYKLTAATGVCHELGWNKSCIDVKVGEYCTIPWPKCDSFWPWNSTVLIDLDIYTVFIPTQLMTNTSGCCYSL